MLNDYQALIHASVQEILQNCLDSKIAELTQRHSQKLHFIPTKFRIWADFCRAWASNLATLWKCW
ncbi:hypothetical protein NHP190003_05190 [Helicobacter sp. NHP19-003]|uniref:Uncharacterized protein n=1 Tax=Helicobacter gastrocanis TaxID=2849641 RepID=A0ABN6I0V0_9HELI|nr:hypothetical protein [Helicobacter sp. NHP19-003]BCZ17237.1 hypothetical protein NHP190003_05190 [Helicobacter sp. NHP19-003]